MLDLLIRGGDVIDGTGRPRRRGSVGVADDRIVLLDERCAEPARRVIDASGLVVAPGFVDIHTHYDAQVFWDPLLTPSCLYGVTTVMAGNCGFTLAPVDKGSSSYLTSMLAEVEGMPLRSLEAAVPWDWTTTEEFLARVEGCDLGINIGFMVGHSAVRRAVMGAEATRRAAEPHEVAAMADLVRRGLAAGAIGFSSSLGLAHLDGDGAPVPSRHAAREEIVELAATCREQAGTSLEFIPGDTVELTSEQFELMAEMSCRAGRPLNWNLMRVRARDLETVHRDLRGGSLASERNGRVVALTMPIPSRARFSFGTGFVLSAIPGWADLFRLPVGERDRALRDSEVRARLAHDALDAPPGLQELVNWGRKVIAEGVSPEAKAHEGRLVEDIAAERGVSAFDALLDIVCDDQLRSTFSYADAALSRADWAANVEVWRDGRAVIGGSDAGAHLDYMGTFDYAVYTIEHAVREHAVISLEEAVALLTAAPAQLYGLKDRGVLRPGAFADVVLFDEARLASGPLRTRHDLPTGAGRLYSEPEGMRGVIVNGQPLVLDGELETARPGRLLRSGRDTETPSLRLSEDS